MHKCPAPRVGEFPAPGSRRLVREARFHHDALRPVVLIALLLTALQVACPAWAQDGASEDPDAERVLRFQTTVTATGSEVDSFDIPMSVSVIQDLEERPVGNAAELLLTEPGVDVNGVGPNQGRPVIRGQRGLRILFLEDGLSLNNPRRQSDFGEITGLVDLDSVDKVEVVRGPASVLYGSGAIGGVLNLIPKTPTFGGDPAVRAGLNVRASSADEQQKYGAWLSGHTGRVAYRVEGSVRDAEDYEAAAGTFGAVRLDNEAVVVDSGIEDDNVTGHVALNVTDRHALSLRGSRYRAGQFGFGFVDPALIDPDFNGTQTRILYPFQDFDRYTLHWSGAGFEGGIANSYDVRVYDQSNERELAFDADINIGPVFPGAPSSAITIDTLNFTDLDTTGVRADARRGFGDDHLLTYGLDWVQDDLFNTDQSDTVTTFRFPFPPSVIGLIPGFTCIDFEPPFECSFSDFESGANTPNAEHTSLGIFVQDEFLATDALKLIVGARYQEVQTRARATPGVDIAGLDFDDQDVVGSLSVLWAATDAFEVVGSVGTAFRSPSIIERLFNGITPEGLGFQLLNPSLESETSEYFDIGFKYRDGRSWIEASYFENQIDDGIIQDFLSPPEIALLPNDIQDVINSSGVSFVVQQRNVDRVKYEGFEVAGALRFASDFTLGGNYTHLTGSRVDSDNPPTGDVPEDKYNLFLRYDRPRYSLEYRVRHNGEADAVVEPGDPVPTVGLVLPEFTVHSLGAFGTLFESDSHSHRLGLVIENASDELYAEFSNIGSFRPQPKRNAILTYRLALK